MIDLKSYIDSARMDGMKSEEDELAKALGLSGEDATATLEAPVAQLKEVPFGSSLAEAQLKAQTQGPSLNIGDGNMPEADSKISGDIASAGILAGANLANSIMGGQAAAGREKRKIEREAASTGAEAKARSSQMAMAGKINPLRQLIASLRR